MNLTQPAKIITFYSYKGGTGRSMALANFAWILALQGKRVLAIDWDVEAPGLHRYFRPFLVDKDLRASTGLIDFAVAFASESVKPADDSLSPEWYVEHADISEHAIRLKWDFSGKGYIDFVPAGRQDATYATRVSTFSWQNFYENLGGGALIDAMRKVLREKGDYDYVLIDSRTGVSDTAGICTVQLPDTLVCCFTYNNQSTDGSLAIAASAQQLRRQPEYARGGLEDLVIYPIPMRVDPFEEDRLRERQTYAWNIFGPILPSNVTVPRTYWTEVEVPYKPALSYEEQLTVFRDEPSDPKSALTAFLRSCNYIIGPEAASLPSVLSPADRQRVIAEFAQTGAAVERVASASAPESKEEATARKAETIFLRLSSDEQIVAQRLFLAMIRATESYETSSISSFRIRREDLDKTYSAIAQQFIDGGVLKMETEGGNSYLAVASPSLLFGWKRLLDWAHDASGFLSWRQRLRAGIEEARSDDSQLLTGSKLKDAQWWLKRRGDDFLPFETAFIERSLDAQKRQRRVGLYIALATITVIAFVTYTRLTTTTIPPPQQPEQSPLAAEKIVVKALSLDDPLLTALLLAEVKTEPANAAKYLEDARVKMQQNIPRLVLRGHTDAVRTVDFSPDDSLILTTGDDQQLLVWGVVNGDLRASTATARASESSQLSIPGARFIDANTIIAIGNSDDPRFVDATGQVFRRVPTIGRALRLAGYDPKSKKTVIYSLYGAIAIVDSSNNVKRVGVNPPLRNVVVNPGLIAALGKTGIWFLTMNGERSGFPRKTLGATTAMAFDDNNFLVAEADGIVWRIDHDSPDSEQLFKTPLSNITAIAPRSNKEIALGNDEGKVLLLDIGGVGGMTFNGHRGAIRDIRFSHNKDLMATASADGTIRVWYGQVPEIPTTFTEIGKSVANRTIACLSAEERSLLLGETAADAQEKAEACEKEHHRVYPDRTAAVGIR